MYAIDLKGFGENVGMEYPYSLDDYILEVKEFLYKNGIKRPHVVAHSFGGRIALKTAYRDSEIFDKLVLTGCAGLKPNFSFKKQIRKTKFNILKHFYDRKKLLKYYSPDYLALSPVMKESFKKIISENLDYTLKGIKNETLILFGNEDKETPLYMARRLHKGIRGSRLEIIDGGHFCFIDNPLLFNYSVKEFLL